jgi:hypothetical protein
MIYPRELRAFEFCPLKAMGSGEQLVTGTSRELSTVLKTIADALEKGNIKSAIIYGQRTVKFPSGNIGEVGYTRVSGHKHGGNCAVPEHIVCWNLRHTADKSMNDIIGLFVTIA